MTRVLFCSQAAHTGGGVEAWLEAVTKALEARGVEVFTALARGRFHDPARYAARHRVANPIEVDGTLGYQEVRIASLLRVFDRIRPDVIIPANLADALYAAALAKARGAPYRIAVCIHGQDDERLDQVRRVAPFVDLATSVAKRVTMRLEAFVEPARVRHIPTGVPPPIAPPRVRERIASIAYVGRLDDRDKRVLDLIDLARALPEVRIHVAGGGPDEQRLRDALPHAVFHGAMSRAELYASLYPAIDALAVFSPAEAGPIVAWEAMAHGIVPVVSDYLGRAEENVIRDGETGIVFPVGDVAEAARKIREAPSIAEISRRAAVELPAAYTLAAFEESWSTAIADCLALPPHRGNPSTLPPLVSPGRLSRLRLPVGVMARLRRVVNKPFVHHDPGSEWPH